MDTQALWASLDLDAAGAQCTEGEDIEVIEIRLADAVQMIATGAIQDGKTIMLLQHAALVGLDKLRCEGQSTQAPIKNSEHGRWGAMI